jgi:N-acyl-D-amino-acid deacylase
MLDILLRNGLILDGSGGASRRADVAIRDGRVGSIGDLSGGEAAEVIDCSGLVVAPGFIDLHAHSELTLLVNAAGESKLHQGVTTELNGQCGLAPFPVRPEHLDEMRSVCTFVGAPVEWTWQTFGDYLARLADARPAYNVATLVGQSALRAWAMGFGARVATSDELDAMCDLLRECLDAGSVGVSLGLSYPLGSFSDTEESRRLAEVAAEHDALVTVHLRNEGPGLHAALDEMLGIAQSTGCRLQIAHLKCIGRAHWGGAAKVLTRLESAVDAGLDVAYDVYPYTAGSRHLYGSLPDWVLDGGVGPMVARLREPETRRRLRESLDAWAEGQGTAGGFSLDFAATMITEVAGDENAWCVGKRLDEIARERGQDPLDATLDLLIEEQGEVSCVLWAMLEDDVQQFLAHPLGCIATDGLAFAPYGPLSKGAPHPRCYGTYARFLGHYVRDVGIVDLPEAVRKCTSLPASRLKLTDRGRIAE